MNEADGPVDDGRGRPVRHAGPVTERVIEIARLLEAHDLADRVADELGIPLSGRQVRALWHVAGAPGMTQSDLATRLGATQSNTSKLCARLQEQGFVEAEAGDDRRVRHLWLTAEGRVAAERLYAAGDELVEGAVATWPADDRGAFVAMLEQLLVELARRTDQPTPPWVDGST